MNAPALRASAITKSFGELRVLNSVNLEAPHGSIVGLIGPNGAGKTTLFNCLSGYTPPDRGTVELEGRDVTGRRPFQIAKAGLVRTFQTARPLRGETVLENVVTGAHLTGKARLIDSLVTRRSVQREETKRAERAEWLLERVGLAHLREALPSQLSGGQLRLLEIARALAAGPKIMLLDEPAAGLNRVETASLERVLREVNDSGMTIVIVEHDVELVLRLCHSVTVINFGEVLMSGAPNKVRASPEVAEAYFGTSGHKASEVGNV